MTAFTANFSLPYPTGDDQPCDFAAQWCDFAAAVNVILDGFQETIDRTVPVIPAAQLRLTITDVQTTALNELIEFDTVGFDTAGWIDFDANPRAISTDRTSVFQEFGASIAQPDGANSYWTLQFYEIDLSDVLSPKQKTVSLDRGSAGLLHGDQVGDMKSYTTPIDVLLRLSNSVATTITINNAALSVWWHADSVRAS